MISLVLAATGGEPREWTFSEDGSARSSLGGFTSYRKNGRIEAAFVRLDDGTNALLQTTTGEYLTILTTAFSREDLAYLLGASGTTRTETAVMHQPAVGANGQASQHKSQARGLRDEAETKRKLAGIESDEAARLERDAERLGARTSEERRLWYPDTIQGLESQAKHLNAAADRNETSVNRSAQANTIAQQAKAEAYLKLNAADRMENKQLSMRNEAATKRAKAAKLLQEASALERRARMLDPEG